jgi:esterase/lipase
MNKKATFFIIPGFKQQVTDKCYAWLVKYLKKQDFNVVGVPINWDHRTMKDYVDQLITTYSKKKTETNYVLGFSYGAVTTFMTANELNPKKVFLCSLSPDFYEDRKSFTPQMIQYIGKRRFTELQTRKAVDVAKKLTVPSVIFCGEKEAEQYPQLLHRCKETSTLAKNSKLIMVSGSPHDISNNEYQKCIIQEIEKLPRN